MRYLLIDNSLPTEFQISANGEYVDVFSYVLKDLNSRQLLFCKTFTPNLRLNEVVEIPDEDLLEQQLSQKLSLDSELPQEISEFVFIDNLRVSPLFQNATLVDLVNMRPKFMSQLTALLGGDSLAAEFLLLFLVSKRQWSKALDFSVNGFSLKLEMSQSPPALVQFLSDLAEHFLNLPLSIEFMNSAAFYSKYHPDGAMAITPGDLQQPSGSVVLVDTFDMQEGNLNETGVKNYFSLLKTMTTNVMECVPSAVIEGSVSIPFNFPLDVHFLVFSPEAASPVVRSSETEKKSFIPADVTVPVRSSGSVERVSSDLDSQEAKKFISYAKSLSESFDISESAGKLIQERFVSDRQLAKGADAVTQKNLMKTEDDLSRRLMIAKWIAISYGSSLLEPNHWESATELQSKLIDRISHVKEPLGQ